MTDRKQKTAAKKIVPRRPKKLLRGSEHQHPLKLQVSYRSHHSRRLYVKHLHKGRANVRSGVYDTDNPGIKTIVHTLHSASAWDGVGDVEVIGP